jgi:hypothetical protein
MHLHLTTNCIRSPTLKERMGWLDMYLPMSLFLIPYGQGSGTTVAIPINENTK